MKPNTINDFWKKVTKTNGCWEWNAGLFHGYGQFKINQKTHSAHRFSYELAYGEIINSLCVLHKCDNKKCVRPDHLFLGTKRENNLDRDRKGRNAKGEKMAASKLTKDDVLYIRSAYQPGKIRQQDFADKFNVSQEVISSVIRGKTWKHVTTQVSR